MEWAEKVLSLLNSDYLQVQFEVLSSRRRQLKLVSFGERAVGLLGELGRQ